VSPHTWTPGYKRDPKLKGQYVPFPQNKTPSDPRKYLPRGPIRSSIPAAMAESERSAKQARDDAAHARKQADNAREQADSARDDAEKARNTVYGVGAIAVIGVIVGVGALVWSSWQLLDSVHERIMGLQSKYVELRGVVETTATSQDVDALENSMKQLQSWIGGPTERTAREELDAVREEVGELRAELRTLREQVGGRQSP
jgi:hypothetical protein